MLSAVEQKAAGQEVTSTPEAPKAQIIDLLEALKRSVSEARDQKAANDEAPPDTKPKGLPRKAEPKAAEAGGAKKKKSAG